MKVLLASLVLVIMPTIAHAQMTPPWWPFSSPPVDNRTEIDRTTTGSITIGAPDRLREFEYSAKNGFGDRSPKMLLRPRA